LRSTLADSIRTLGGRSPTLSDIMRLGVIVAALVVGLFVRLYGITSSLWLDEFGSLWVVEASLGEAWARALEFQGQSPLYYLLTWIPIHLVGESEAALRSTSLLFSAAAVPVVYQLGKELAGERCGMLAGLMVWFDPFLLATSVEARPYALALFFAALHLLGFVRATARARPADRAMFILGAVGLFYSHYLLATLVLGTYLAYLSIRALREQYRPAQFLLDLGIQGLLTVPGLIHLMQLFGRRGELSWLGAPDFTVGLFLLATMIVPLVAGWILAEDRAVLCRPADRAVALAAAMPVIVVYGLAALGINLLTSRYLIVPLIPIAVLAARAVLAVPQRRFVVMIISTWFVGIAGIYAACLPVFGYFTHAFANGRWREAVEVLDDQLQRDPGPVLFRSGFVEEDLHMSGRTIPVSRAPLRSPGCAAPAWNSIIPLTFRWKAPQRAAYFDAMVAPAVRDVRVFYILCRRGLSYRERLLRWAQEECGGPWDVRELYKEGDSNKSVFVTRVSKR